MKDKRLDHIIIGLVIFLVIFIASFWLISHYHIFDKDTFVFENDFPVKKVGDTYLLTGYIGNQPLNLGLPLDPRTIKDIPSEETLRDTLLKDTKVIHITMDNNLTAQSMKASLTIQGITKHESLFNIPTYGAVTENITDILNLNVKTCLDANPYQKIILLKLADETRIFSRNDCIILQGKTEEDIVRASEKLVLQLLGILKE